MEIGTTFPQMEIGNDPGAIRAFGEAAEGLGYTFIGATDHVLSVNRTDFTGLRRTYDARTPFHETFVSFGFLAACTKRIVFAPSVIVLPQRQAAVVAKQCATLDILSGGRFRLGAGIGWDAIEYKALGQTFLNRARRFEEQIEVMRLLWTNDIVTFEGKYHSLEGVVLNPPPTQRPIPVWIAAIEDVALKRVARMGDGWCSQLEANEKGDAMAERMRGFLRENGRDPAGFPCEVLFKMNTIEQDQWEPRVRRYAAMGVTHLKVDIMGLNQGVEGHIASLKKFREVFPA